MAALPEKEEGYNPFYNTLCQKAVLHKWASHFASNKLINLNKSHLPVINLQCEAVRQAYISYML